MNGSQTSDILNRILTLHERSLPAYLSYAAPWEIAKEPQVAAVIAQIVDDHKRTVDRLAKLILENHDVVDNGEFPMSFTSLHDLSVDYLLKQVIDRQRKMISVLAKLADMLATAPYAQAAAREALGEAKGHLENLEEVARHPADA